MSLQPNPTKLPVTEIAQQMRDQMIPLSARFSYFFTALTLSDDDIKEYLEDPVAALPPSIRSILPEVSVLLVPFLEKSSPEAGEENGGRDHVCFEPPDEKLQASSSAVNSDNSAVFFFAIKDLDVSEYHHRLFRRLAALASGKAGEDVTEKFSALVREELEAEANGEVDTSSWELKQSLLQRQKNFDRPTKIFTKYVEQALVDTMTLYLHGICCDIDVETGPRQLASRYLRRRLDLLKSFFPPPEGYAVFPEDLNHVRSRK